MTDGLDECFFPTRRRCSKETQKIGEKVSTVLGSGRRIVLACRAFDFYLDVNPQRALRAVFAPASAGNQNASQAAMFFRPEFFGEQSKFVAVWQRAHDLRLIRANLPSKAEETNDRRLRFRAAFPVLRVRIVCRRPKMRRNDRKFVLIARADALNFPAGKRFWLLFSHLIELAGPSRILRSELGCGKKQFQFFETWMTLPTATHPTGFSNEPNRFAKGQIRRSDDVCQQKRLVLIAPHAVGRHALHFWQRPLNGAGFESGRELPTNARWKADGSRIFPISVKSGRNLLVKRHGEALSGNDARLVGDNLDINGRETRSPGLCIRQNRQGSCQPCYRQNKPANSNLCASHSKKSPVQNAPFHVCQLWSAFLNSGSSFCAASRFPGMVSL